MNEAVHIYLVGGGVVLLAAAVGAGLALRSHPLVSIQILISIAWSALAVLHVWGPLDRVLQGLSEDWQLPARVVSVVAFWLGFLAFLVPWGLIIRWFHLRLRTGYGWTGGTWLRIVCGWGAGLFAAILVTTSTAIIIPRQVEGAVPRLVKKLGRAPVRVYLLVSGNWAAPGDPPKGFADFVDRWLASAEKPKL